jgi:hypothetical protein
MRTLSSRSRSIAAIAASALTLALGACSSHTTLTPTPSPALVRAVHGSPDAGPVDIYVYAQGAARPSTPTVAAAAYPQITSYLSLPPGAYTVDVVDPAGSPSTTAAVATENVTIRSKVAYSIVGGGKVANKTLTFVNFVEPTETAGQTALIVHHASPFVQNALDGPVGVGVYDASQTAPTSIAQLFGFSLTTPISGPAASGGVSGGQFFLSPLPSGLPTAFTTLITATPSQLASGLKNPTSAQQTLAADTSSAIPAGAHVSIFAVDTTSAAQLIGTLDP